jgi:hypothetical protein
MSNEATGGLFGYNPGMSGKFVIVLLAVAAVASAALGVYSLWHRVGWRKSITDRHWASVAVESGNLQLAFARISEEDRPRRRRGVYLGVLGAFQTGSGRSEEWNYSWVVLPLWPIVLGLVACPAWRIVRVSVRARTRRAKGYCAECGYDLTGNQSGVCPECGKEAPPNASAARRGTGLPTGRQGGTDRNEEPNRMDLSA